MNVQSIQEKIKKELIGELTAEKIESAIIEALKEYDEKLMDNISEKVNSAIRGR